MAETRGPGNRPPGPALPLARPKRDTGKRWPGSAGPHAHTPSGGSPRQRAWGP